MTVVAPSTDLAGAALDARIAAMQALVNANRNPAVLAQNKQQLNQLQVAAVDHYMVTGWLNAAAILATYSAPAWDIVGRALASTVAFLQNRVNHPPTMPPGNADGYGDSGWTTILQDSQQRLYAAQITLVEHIMDVPGGTSAAAILAGLTGFQSFPFDYVFSSVGSTDQWIDG